MAQDGSSLVNDSFVAGFFGGIGFLAALGLVFGGLFLTDEACGTSFLPRSRAPQTIQGDECETDDDCWRTEVCEYGYCTDKE